MLCNDVRVNLPDFILDKIEPNLKKYIESHLKYCAKCRAEYGEMKDPISLLGQAGVEVYPDAFWQELRASIMEKVSEPRRRPWRSPAFAAGLAVLLIAIGIGVYRIALRHSPRSPSVTALATTLPADQAVALPMLNVNYVNTISSQANVIDEMDAVDDSMQEAVVRSLWASVGDSSSTLEDYIYSGTGLSN